MSVCEPLVCVVCGSQSSNVSRPPSRETWTYTSWSVAVVKVFYTHHTHIKAKGNMSSPCLEILSSFSSFFPLAFAHSLETGTKIPTPLFFPRFTPNTPLCQLVFSHILHAHFILYFSVLTFHSLFHISYHPLRLTSTSKPLSLRPSERNPGRFSSQCSTYHCEVNHQPFFLSLLRCVR